MSSEEVEFIKDELLDRSYLEPTDDEKSLRGHPLFAHVTEADWKRFAIEFTSHALASYDKEEIDLGDLVETVWRLTSTLDWKGRMNLLGLAVGNARKSHLRRASKRKRSRVPSWVITAGVDLMLHLMAKGPALKRTADDTEESYAGVVLAELDLLRITGKDGMYKLKPRTLYLAMRQLHKPSDSET